MKSVVKPLANVSPNPLPLNQHLPHASPLVYGCMGLGGAGIIMA